VVAAPWWAVTLLIVLWLAALLLAIMWFTTRPRAVALLPAVVTLVWVATAVGGALYLGWA